MTISLIGISCSNEQKYIFSIYDEQDFLFANLQETDMAYSILPPSKQYKEIEKEIRNLKFKKFIIMIESNTNVSDYFITYYGFEKDKICVYYWDFVQNEYDYKEYQNGKFHSKSKKPFIYLSEKRNVFDATTHYLVINNGKKIFRRCFYGVASFQSTGIDYIDSVSYLIDLLEDK